MKPLLAALPLYLFTFGPLARAQQASAWPRNPATGKAKFRGALPWPAGIKTQAQRKALVQG